MFDLRVGFEQPVGSKILSLNAIFSAMLSENGSNISKETLSVMQRAIKRTYDMLFKEEPRLVRTIRLANEAQEQVLSGTSYI